MKPGRRPIDLQQLVSRTRLHPSANLFSAASLDRKDIRLRALSNSAGRVCSRTQYPRQSEAAAGFTGSENNRKHRWRCMYVEGE